MRTTPLPDQATLHALLRYDPATGKLFWRPRPQQLFRSDVAMLTWNGRFANKEAFTAKGPDGYFRGTIHYTHYLAHRVIFKLLHGYEPEQIDHDDRNPQNNRSDNLIDSTATGNSRNCKLYASNTSGHTGVCWDVQRQCWIVQIIVARRTIHLGRFKKKTDAIKARLRAEVKYGFHPNHGR